MSATTFHTDYEHQQQQCAKVDSKKRLTKCTFAIMDDVTETMAPLSAPPINEEFRRKRRQSLYAKPINAIWELFSEYSNGSTIHGLRYLGEKRRHWTERIWWAIACLFSLICCGNLIWVTWQKWDKFPVLVTFAEKSTHIDQIPFPAITICPSTKIKQSLFNYTTAYNQYRNGERMPETNLSTLRTVSNLCYLANKTLTANEQYADDRIVFETLQQYVPTLKEVIFQCIWRGRKSACTEYFQKIWTSEGLCFSFNLLNATDMYTKQRLSSHIPNDTHDPIDSGDHSSNESNASTTLAASSSTTTTAKPRKATGDQRAAGTLRRAALDRMYPRRVSAASDQLVVEMRLYDKDTDYLCEGPVQGFKLLLHGEHEQPQVDKYFYRVPLDHEVIVSVKPELMETSNSLKHYSAERRQCYFGDEHRLRFHRNYSQRNCELECLTAVTLRQCDCVTLSMPRNSTTKVCGLARKPCYSSVRLSLDDNCNCLPACRSITYDAELSFARYNRRRYQHGLNRTYPDRRQYVRLAISFKDNQFFASHRRELYGRTDFLANCGGLLGLFMGFSLLSIVEVVYYCTLRLACNLQRRRQAKRKAGSRRPLVELTAAGSADDQAANEKY